MTPAAGESGQRVVVKELAEVPLEAVDNHMALEPMDRPDPAKLAATDVIVAIESASVGWVVGEGAVDGGAAADGAAAAVASGVAGSVDAVARPDMSDEICSRVSGPRRYDIAQRLVKRVTAELPARRNRNSRFASPAIVAPSDAVSTVPSAADRPSSRREVSCWVWSRPTIQVPALDIAL